MGPMTVGMDQMRCTVVNLYFCLDGVCQHLLFFFYILIKVLLLASFSSLIVNKDTLLVSQMKQDCIKGTHSLYAGSQTSSTATSPRSCPTGQFSCPPPGGCIAAGLRCDGIRHCPGGEDENGCRPHDITTQSVR